METQEKKQEKMKIKEKVLKEVQEAYDLTKPEEFRCKKSIDLTLAEVCKVIDEELIECKRMLRENPLNDYWLGREIVLEKIKQKLGGGK